MGAPDIFLRSKVPQDMFHILQQFAEIRKLARLSLVRDFNLFPSTEKLLTLERKYGDSLNVEDMTGKPGKAKKKKDPMTSSVELGSQSQGTGAGLPKGGETGFSVEGLGSVGDLNQTANTLGGSNADISPTKGVTNATGVSNIKISN